MLLALAGLLSLSALAQPADPVCVDLKGNQVVPLSRQQTPRPKATVLVFYIAHCPIGQKLVPEINRIYKEFRSQGVNFYMVHEDHGLKPAELAQEAKTFGLLPPVLIDKWHTQMKRSGVTISPEAVVYDADMRLRYQGRISDLFYGLGKMKPKATSRDLRDAIAAVLGGQPPRVAKTEAIGCTLPKN